MEYKTFIVNELGHIMYDCSKLSYDEEMEILDNHPEWYRSTEQVNDYNWY